MLYVPIRFQFKYKTDLKRHSLKRAAKVLSLSELSIL